MKTSPVVGLKFWEPKEKGVSGTNRGYNLLTTEQPSGCLILLHYDQISDEESLRIVQLRQKGYRRYSSAGAPELGRLPSEQGARIAHKT